MALETKNVMKYIFLVAAMLVLPLFSVAGISAETEQITRAPGQSKRNILIINSYSEVLSWTNSQNAGILKQLRINDNRFNISVENMDWKAYPTEENLEHLYNYVKYKYLDKSIDIIISTDDAALEFAIKYRKELFNDAPIVFCGINQKGFEDLAQYEKNITGIIEQVDPLGTIEGMLKINRNLKDIYVIFDNSESGISTWELTKKSAEDLPAKVNLIPLNKGSHEDILKVLSQIQGDSAILVTTYFMDEAGEAVGFERFSRMVGNTCKVPVYHLYDFGLENGAMGGSMISGETQGELAGDLALRILNGEDINTLPIYSGTTAEYKFDYKLMKEYGIRPSSLPNGSIIINKPVSILDQYRNYVISALVLLVIMTVFIIVLMINLRKVNRMKQELTKSHNELSRLYEDLTASEEELRMQYSELTQTQQNLLVSEERYRQLYEKMLNGYFIFEPVLDNDKNLKDLRFVELNPSFTIHMKKDIRNLPGKTWREVFNSINPDLPVYQNVVETGCPKQFEAYNAETNEYYWVNAFKIDDNQVGVVFDNITNYKMAIREVRKLNAQLEERVRERTQELQSAVNQLESFTYTVTHDLKAPLRAINSYIRIVFEDYGKTLNKQVTDMLSNVSSISKEMITMIEKLLEYSTASRAQLGIEEINMEQKFKTCFNELRAAYPDREIDLIIETGMPNIYADRILIKQVITNILSNAFKFTKEREHAQIRVGSTLTENAYVFYVRDNGIGFDMNYSGKLFRIFQRLHTSDEYEGTGIGLVTIRNIIEKHGGKVWIEGEVGVGATIYFTIPYIE